MTQPIRVCMLSFYFPPAYSGSAVQAHALSRELRHHGVAPTIVSANLTHSAAQDVLDGIPLQRLPLLKRKALQVPTFGASLSWYLWRNRACIDVVHAHGAMPHFVAGPVARMLGRKSILKIAMAHSDIAFHRQGRFTGRMHRWCASRFDRFVATSAEAYDECLERGFPRTHVLQIPNGVDSEHFRPAESSAERRALRARLGVPDGPLVCFVGILDARKNVDGILRVWAEVRRRTASGHLVLVGPDSADATGSTSQFARQLRAYVVSNGLGESVTFTGQRSDIAECLRCADIFFFPSRREGMPNVLLEAMATGLACVTSAIGGIVDLLENGVSGRVFSIDDESGMASGIAELVQEPAKITAFGRAARERVVRLFSLRFTAETYARLYRELLRDA